MTLKLQIMLLIALVLALIFVIVQIKNRKLDLKYSLTWFVLISILLILTVFPQLLVFFSGLFGFASEMNMLFVFGFCLALVIIYTLTIAVSKLTDQVRTLTQKIALLESDIKQKDKEEA